jgi:uncharacterized protein
MLTIETARSWYPSDDPVHGFDHVMRVYRLAERIARAEGADLEIVRAAVLLHDSSPPAAGPPQRQDHQHASASFARQVLEGDRWAEERIEAVLHCIRAHRFRDESESPRTLEARVVFDADKLDAIGAIGAVRAVAYAAAHGAPAYAEPSPRFRQTGQREPGEPHSAYHEYVFKLSRLKERLFTPTARQIAEGRHRFLAEFYERLGAELDGKD